MGAPVTGGKITATLSSPGTTLDGVVAVTVNGRVVADIDPNGRPVGLVLVPNDAITPAGTYYQVQISATGPNPTSWFRKWSVTTSPDPVDIGAVTVLDVIPSLTSVIDNLADVTVTSPSDEQCLVIDVPGNVWTNKTCPGGAGTLDGLTDVTVTTPSNLDNLYYETATGLWKNAAHQGLSTGVHGVGALSSVVGTGTAQTIINKTIDGQSNTIQQRREATDCTALINGKPGQICYEQDADALYVCEDADADDACTDPAEWRPIVQGSMPDCADSHTFCVGKQTGAEYATVCGAACSPSTSTCAAGSALYAAQASGLCTTLTPCLIDIGAGLYDECVTVDNIKGLYFRGRGCGITQIEPTVTSASSVTGGVFRVGGITNSLYATSDIYLQDFTIKNSSSSAPESAFQCGLETGTGTTSARWNNITLDGICTIGLHDSIQCSGSLDGTATTLPTINIRNVYSVGGRDNIVKKGFAIWNIINTDILTKTNYCDDSDTNITGMRAGTVAAGTSTTVFQLGATEHSASDDKWSMRRIWLYDADGAGAGTCTAAGSSWITDYVSSTDVVTVSPALGATPGTGCSYGIDAAIDPGPCTSPDWSMFGDKWKITGIHHRGPDAIGGITHPLDALNVKDTRIHVIVNDADTTTSSTQSFVAGVLGYTSAATSTASVSNITLDNVDITVDINADLTDQTRGVNCVALQDQMGVSGVYGWTGRCTINNNVDTSITTYGVMAGSDATSTLYVPHAEIEINNPVVFSGTATDGTSSYVGADPTDPGIGIENKIITTNRTVSMTSGTCNGQSRRIRFSDVSGYLTVPNWGGCTPANGDTYTIVGYTGTTATLFRDKSSTLAVGNIVSPDPITTSGTITHLAGMSSTLVQPLFVDGSTDAIQATVQGHSTQTSNILVVETSAGTDLLTVNNSGTVTATTFAGALTGNASTATALAANGSNCSAGNYPLGVSAAGAAESCTADTGAGTNATALSWNVTPATCTGDGNGGNLTVNGSNQIVCAADDGGAGGGDSITVEDGDNAGTFSATTDADFEDSGDINFVLTGNDISGLVRANAVALTTDTTGNYVLDVADGTGIDGTASGEGTTYTPTLDLTEVTSVTWSAGGSASMTQTFNVSGTDVVVTQGSGTTDFSGTVTGTSFTADDPGDNLRGVELTDNTTSCADPASGNTAICTIAGEPFTRDTGGTSREILYTAGGDYGDFTCTTGACATDATFALTGDVTSSNKATTIGADKVLESMLKVVNAGTDEQCLTKETTTGDFEWQDCAVGGSGDVTDVGPGCATGACFTDGLATSGTTLLIWEGTTADTNELSVIVPADPGADVNLTLPTATTTIVGHDTTNTLTNKTLDAEGTGNVITMVSRAWLPAATCQNATATANFDTPTANAAAPACVTGTNTQKAYLDFDQTTDESVQGTLMLPADWTGNIDVDYKWLTTATTGSVAWCFQTICVADAETGDPAFAAQASGNCVSDAAKGTTNQTNDAADTAITITGCAAGELMHYRISRDPDETATLTDNLAADARLIGVLVTMRRAQ